MNQQTNRGFLYGLLGVTAFSLTLPFTKIAVVELHPLFIGFGRAFVAAVPAMFILLLFSKKTEQPLPNKKQFLQLIAISLGIVVGFPIFISLAMRYVPSAYGAVVVGISPLATAVVSMMVTREKTDFRFWLWSLSGTSLVLLYIFLHNGLFRTENIFFKDFLLGNLFLFLAVTSSALGYGLGGKLSKELKGWQVICWALVMSLPFVTFPALYYKPQNFYVLSLQVILSFLYLSLISQLFGFFVWYKGLALGGIARVSQVQLLQTFLTIAFSAFLLHEKIDSLTILFSVLVVGMVWAVKR